MHHIAKIFQKGKSHIRRLQKKLFDFGMKPKSAKKKSGGKKKSIKASRKVSSLRDFAERLGKLDLSSKSDLSELQFEDGEDSHVLGEERFVKHEHLFKLGKGKMKYLKSRKAEMEKRVSEYAAKIKSTNNVRMIRQLRDTLKEFKKFDLGEEKREDKLYLMRLHKMHDKMSRDMKKLIVQDDQDLLKNFSHQRRNRVVERLRENLQINSNVTLNLDQPMDTAKLMQKAQAISQRDTLGEVTDSTFYQVYRKVKIYDKRDYPEYYKGKFERPEKISVYLENDKKILQLKESYLDAKYGKERKTNSFMKIIATHNGQVDKFKVLKRLHAEKLVQFMQNKKDDQLINFVSKDRKNKPSDVKRRGSMSMPKEGDSEAKDAPEKAGEQQRLLEQVDPFRPFSKKELLEHFLSKRDQVPKYREHAQEMIKKSLAKYARQRQGRAEIRRFAQLSEDGYIREEAKRVARRLSDSDASVKEFEDKHGLKQLLENPYFKDFAGLGIEGSHEMLAGVVQGILDEEKSRLERKLFQMVMRDHEQSEQSSKRPIDFAEESEQSVTTSGPRDNQSSRHCILSNPRQGEHPLEAPGNTSSDTDQH